MWFDMDQCPRRLIGWESVPKNDLLQGCRRLNDVSNLEQPV
jgi:hypothetical protein